MQWNPMDTVPLDSSRLLVLLPVHTRPTGAELPRIQPATYGLDANGKRFGIIGSRFDFDLPEPLGWVYEADLIP